MQVAYNIIIATIAKQLLKIEFFILKTYSSFEAVFFSSTAYKTRESIVTILEIAPCQLIKITGINVADLSLTTDQSISKLNVISNNKMAEEYLKILMLLCW